MIPVVGSIGIKNEKFKERLVRLYQGDVPEKGTLPDSDRLSTESIA